MAFDTRNIKNRLFINGELIPSVSGRKVHPADPIINRVTIDVFEADVDDVDQAVVSAHAAFSSQSETDGEGNTTKLNTA